MSGLQHRPLRVGLRLLGFIGVLFLTALDYILRVWFTGNATSIHARTRWMQKWSGRILRCVRVHARYHGQPPKQGMLVSNHISYLDILVYGQAHPFVFVSKSEVKHWPGLGWLTSWAGTLFLRRDNKADVVNIADQFAPLIEQGVVVAIFPEGTSSDGRQVLPFRSSLLEPAAANGWPVSPAWIGYQLAKGSVEVEVCYWGDMTFVPHLLNLLSQDHIDAFVSFGSPLPPGLDRKTMTRELHARVCQLAAQQRSGAGECVEVKAGNEM